MLKRGFPDLDFAGKCSIFVVPTEQAADTQMRYKVLKRRQGLVVCNQVRAFLNENDITGVYLEQDSLR